MKKELKNIDEIFKQAFDEFEADVDPSIWNNILFITGTVIGDSLDLHTNE